MIKAKLAHVRSEIASICRAIGRDPQEITLVGVTKYATVDVINEAIALGLTDVAENRVQEASVKFPALKRAQQPVRRHLIGHLQRNKVKDAIAVCDLIQSLDSLRLAQEIDKQAGKTGKSVDVLLQVNTSGEKQKYGVSKDEALPLLEEINRLENVRVVGLMTIAPMTDDEAVLRQTFRDLRLVRDDAREQFAGSVSVRMDILSMGMSSDYRIALEEGSNMVRIGSAIFK